MSLLVACPMLRYRVTSQTFSDQHVSEVYIRNGIFVAIRITGVDRSVMSPWCGLLTFDQILTRIGTLISLIPDGVG